MFFYCGHHVHKMSTLPTFLVFDSKRVEIKKCLNPLCYIGLKHVCGRGDLNPHGSPRYPLNIVGLVSNRCKMCETPYFIDVVRTYKIVSCRKKAYFFIPRVHIMSTSVDYGLAILAMKGMSLLSPNFKAQMAWNRGMCRPSSMVNGAMTFFSPLNVSSLELYNT